MHADGQVNLQDDARTNRECEDTIFLLHAAVLHLPCAMLSRLERLVTEHTSFHRNIALLTLDKLFTLQADR